MSGSVYWNLNYVTLSDIFKWYKVHDAALLLQNVFLQSTLVQVTFNVWNTLMVGLELSFMIFPW